MVTRGQQIQRKSSMCGTARESAPSWKETMVELADNKKSLFCNSHKEILAVLWKEVVAKLRELTAKPQELRPDRTDGSQNFARLRIGLGRSLGEEAKGLGGGARPSCGGGEAGAIFARLERGISEDVGALGPR